MILTADIFSRVLGQPAAQAWLTGLFLFIGFLIHLALDEIYSVDVEGRTIKKSFGTALKLFDTHSLGAFRGDGRRASLRFCWPRRPRKTSLRW